VERVVKLMLSGEEGERPRRRFGCRGWWVRDLSYISEGRRGDLPRAGPAPATGACPQVDRVGHSRPLPPQHSPTETALTSSLPNPPSPRVTNEGHKGLCFREEMTCLILSLGPGGAGTLENWRVWGCVRWSEMWISLAVFNQVPHLQRGFGGILKSQEF
jgi:hypothetical protein